MSSATQPCGFPLRLFQKSSPTCQQSYDFEGVPDGSYTRDIIGTFYASLIGSDKNFNFRYMFQRAFKADLVHGLSRKSFAGSAGRILCS